MNILYLTPADPRTAPLTWAGTALSMLRGMEARGHRVHVITVQSPWGDPYTRLKRQAYRKLTGRMYFRDVDPVNLVFLRRMIRKAVKGLSFDAVFSWLPWMTTLIDTDKPKLFWYDTTYLQAQPLYFPNVCRASHEQSLRLDRAAVAGAAAAIYSSEASRRAAIDQLGGDPGNTFTIPFGANLTDVPAQAAIGRALADRLSRRITNEPIRLLFVGLNWKRKGGQTALQTLATLKAMGLSARLTVVGASPEIPSDLASHVALVGNLDKQKPADLKWMNDLYLNSDWFFMTSRAESFGIAYCEAMAHALPSLATRTGAVAEIVRPGETGELFDFSPNVADQIARTVTTYSRDPSRYRQLCESSRRAYDVTFNWSTAWARFDDILRRVTASAD